VCERGAHAEAPEPEIPFQRLSSAPTVVRAGVRAGGFQGTGFKPKTGTAVDRQRLYSVPEISAAPLLSMNDETDRTELKNGKNSRSRIKP